jgi:hypothetical protein
LSDLIVNYCNIVDGSSFEKFFVDDRVRGENVNPDRAMFSFFTDDNLGVHKGIVVPPFSGASNRG